MGKKMQTKTKIKIYEKAQSAALILSFGSLYGGGFLTLGGLGLKLSMTPLVFEYPPMPPPPSWLSFETLGITFAASTAIALSGATIGRMLDSKLSNLKELLRKEDAEF